MTRVKANSFLSSESLSWQPDYVEPSAWLKHIPFAFWLIENLNPRSFVELGVHNGTSYFAFCQAIERLNLDTASYAIDTWKGDEQAGFYGEEIFAKVSRYNESHYSRFSTLLRSTFDEARQYFTNESVDLLHIDGLHTYEAVKHDFETWFPSLSKNAIVVLHDINVREREFGVFRFWDELKKTFPHFEFDFGFGLGIISLGEQYSLILKSLFEDNKSSEYYHFIRNLFADRGNFFESKLQTTFLIAETKNQLTWHQEELKRSNEALSIATERLKETELSKTKAEHDLEAAKISYEHWHRYIFASRFCTQKTILDVACGEGFGSDFLSRSAESVFGIDIDPNVIEHAKRKYVRDNLNFLPANAVAMPFESQNFDVVVSFETFEHLNKDDQNLFFREISRVLKDDGVLVMSTPDKKIYSDEANYSNPFHLSEFYKDEFKALLLAYFKSVMVFSQHVIAGSLISRKNERGYDIEHIHLERDGFIPGATGEVEMEYMIAVCSRDNLPSICGSILLDDSNALLKS